MYFANGTEGEIFEAKWCARCLHNVKPHGESPGCPVLYVHSLFNYEQCGDDEGAKAIHGILSTMIAPQSDIGSPCITFEETTTPLLEQERAFSALMERWLSSRVAGVSIAADSE